MKMLLRGRPTDARSGKVFPVRNPASGEVIDTVPQAGPDDVREAIEIAKCGRRIMAALPAYRRSEILSKTADLIAAQFDDLVRLLTAENGKTVRQCRAEMKTTQRLFVDFAEEAKRIKGEVLPMDNVPGLEHMLAYTVRQPVRNSSFVSTRSSPTCCLMPKTVCWTRARTAGSKAIRR